VGKLFAVAVMAAFLADPLSAARAESAADLARLERDIAVQKETAKSLEEKEKETAASLDALSQKLIAAGEALAGKTQEQESLEERLDALEKETSARRAKLDAARGRMAVLTRVFLHFSRQMPALTVLSEEDPDAIIRRSILVRAMLPRLMDETDGLAQEVEKTLRLQARAEAQRVLVQAAQRNLEKQKEGLNQLVQARRGLLVRTAEEKEALAVRIEGLRNEAKDLRELMEKVEDPSWKKAIGKGTVRRAARSGGVALKLPVAGKVLRGYGDRDEFGVVSDGVTFLGTAGGPIIAPRGGRIVFAGAFRGYGKAVIVHHDGGFYSFLSGFARIDADVGQAVEAGEPLGLLPVKGEGAAELYFEYRKEGRPVKPFAS